MPTHYTGSAEEQKALNAYIALMRASQSVTARLAALRGPDGLTPTQLGVLEVLLHLGPLCQRDLAAKLLTTGGNVTTVIDNLERMDMVRRVRSRDDRRFVTVHLTDAGRSRIAGIFPRHASDIAREFAALTPAEQDSLRKICRILGTQQRNTR